MASSTFHLHVRAQVRSKTPRVETSVVIANQHPQDHLYGKGGGRVGRVWGESGAGVSLGRVWGESGAGFCRNCVGNVGTSVETVVETVANIVETVEYLFWGWII